MRAMWHIFATFSLAIGYAFGGQQAVQHHAAPAPKRNLSHHSSVHRSHASHRHSARVHALKHRASVKHEGHTVVLKQVDVKHESPKPERDRHEDNHGWVAGSQADTLYKSAVSEVHRHHYHEATLLCQQGLAVVPGDATFTLLLGQIPGEESAYVASEVDKECNLATDFLSQGRIARAKISVDNGLKIAPGNPRLLALLDECSKRRAEQNGLDARKDYEEAVALANAGDYSKAESKCKSGLKKEPGNEELTTLLEQIRARRHKG